MVPVTACGRLLAQPWVVRGYELAARWLGLVPAAYRDVAVAVSAPWTSGRSCHITYDGVRVHAWLILKCNSNGVDANLESLLSKGGHEFLRRRRLSPMNTSANTSLSSAQRHASFAVVRDPMDHFISGYSEAVAYRLADLEAGSQKWHSAEQALRDVCATGAISYACLPDPKDRAAAFLRDYVQVRTNRVRLPFQTTHTNNQASFLCMNQDGGRSVSGAGYVIYLDEMSYGWERFGIEAGLQHWPAFEPDLFTARLSGTLYHGSRPHNKSDWLSNNAHREAMKSVLEDETNCRALCSVLLIDYVCFKFPLPWCCATSTALVQGKPKCPIPIGKFLGKADLPPPELIDSVTVQGRLANA